MNVYDLSFREELIGCHHPAWPDPLHLRDRERAREWLEENQHHPNIQVRHRLVSDWAVLPASELRGEATGG